MFAVIAGGRAAQSSGGFVGDKLEKSLFEFSNYSCNKWNWVQGLRCVS